jgi:predicted MFS family arabinose efflux permease
VSQPLPRPFVNLAWSNLAAQSAEQISLAAIPMVAVLALGAGPGETGLLAAAQTLPFLLLSIPAGLLADRASRRQLMIAAEALRAGSLLVLVVLALTGAMSVLALAVLGFLGATGTVVFSVAGPAIVPALVPRDALSRANGRMELARSAAFAGGPALAGALVGWLGASPAFVLATILSLGAVALLVSIREPKRTPAPRRHVLHELHEGAVFVFGHRWLRPILATTVVWNLGWFILVAAYVPYAVATLQRDAAAIGPTLAVMGVGMIVTSLLAPRMLPRLPFGTALVVGPVASVIASFTMLATLWWPSFAVASLSYFLFGAGPVLWTISQITLRQTVTPNALLGRVSALFMTASAGSRPLGAALGGWIGESWGLQACLVVSFAVFVGQLLVIVLSPLPALRALPKPAAG